MSALHPLRVLEESDGDFAMRDVASRLGTQAENDNLRKVSSVRVVAVGNFTRDARFLTIAIKLQMPSACASIDCSANTISAFLHNPLAQMIRVKTTLVF
jgi:hypothetical protein